MKSLLTFRARGTLYGLEASLVLEVVELPAISPWPAAPKGMAGVIDYRGEVIPVLDISARLGGPNAAIRETDQLIVISLGQGKAGLLVEEALDLFSAWVLRAIPSPVPSSLKAVAPFLSGMTGSGEQMVLVLDGERLAEFGETPPSIATAPPLPPSEAMALRARELARPSTVLEPGEQRHLVVVRLSGERLGVPVAEVAALTDRPPFTSVPGAPQHLLGLAYHRGGLLRLVDIRAMCGLDASGPAPVQVVILSGPGMPTGLTVDAIESVTALKGAGAKLAFEGGWLTVLDTDKLDVRESATALPEDAP